jgi:hypothetical protein
MWNLICLLIGLILGLAFNNVVEWLAKMNGVDDVNAQ